MAWKKSIEQDQTGAVAEYWEVMSVSYNHRTQLSALRVGGWVNKAAYDSNKEPLQVKFWEIPAGLAPQLAAGAVQFVSGYAKSQPEFEGWENV